ncbi:hypothetical protein U9M48_034763 [Paspalum notatum var. saurae]|uniref:Uncharacterized protein n=1 Tax=Paspalum notatum var. saurae TaxID=547442 RepID=A0AAQ3UB37_PASNO
MGPARISASATSSGGNDLAFTSSFVFLFFPSYLHRRAIASSLLFLNSPLSDGDVASISPAIESSLERASPNLPRPAGSWKHYTSTL